MKSNRTRLEFDRHCVFNLLNFLARTPTQPFLLGLVAWGLLAFSGCQDSNSQTMSAKGAKSTIEASLRIQFGGLAEDYSESIRVTEPAVVFDVLRAGLGDELEYTGTGSGLFIKAIRGVANQGAGGPNWVYRVNGELGNVSCGVRTVEAGDEITWSLGSYSPDDSQKPTESTD